MIFLLIGRSFAPRRALRPAGVTVTDAVTISGTPGLSMKGAYTPNIPAKSHCLDHGKGLLRVDAANLSFAFKCYRDITSSQLFIPSSIRTPRRALTNSIFSRCYSSCTDRKQDSLQDVQEGVRNEARKASEEESFIRSHRASQAAKADFSARLSSSGQDQDTASFTDIRRLISIAKPESRWLLLAFAFLFVSSTVGMLIPFSIGRILDVAALGDDASGSDGLFGLTITQYFVGLGVILTVASLAIYGETALLGVMGHRVISRLRAQLYRRTFVQDAEFFDANRVGDLISRLGSDTRMVGNSITQNLSDGLGSLFIGVAGFAVMVWTSPKLTGILLLIFPPTAIGAAMYGRAVSRLSRSMQQNLGTLSKIAEERLSNVKTSQAFVGEVREVGRYNRQLRKVYNVARQELLFTGTFYASAEWAGKMTIVLTLLVGSRLVQSGALSLGDLTSFIMYAAYTGGGFFGVASFYSELMKGAGAASRLFELQDRQPRIPSTVGKHVASAKGNIEFRNVSFAYPTRPAVKIFQDISFTIPSGSKVCIVGPSGCGKSSVASLLLRFYDPTAGTIRIHGADITKLSARSLRKRIGMVSQEPALFSDSIANNIAYGKPDATHQEIQAVARRANCDFIDDLPGGLDTQVGVKGSQLSGGQKQRIAIARALLKNADILILDEATAALDAKSESLVNAALENLLQHQGQRSITTISIAHRLSTIQRSDQVIVLTAAGTVAETGGYTELIAKKDSALSKLLKIQMPQNLSLAGDREDDRPSETDLV